MRNLDMAIGQTIITIRITIFMKEDPASDTVLKFIINARKKKLLCVKMRFDFIRYLINEL